jgi:alcohol dehydrogenase class IV
MSPTFSFHGPTRIVFGDGVLAEAGRHIPFPGRILVVTGKSSAGRCGHLERLLAGLPGRDVRVFSGVSPNPRLSEVLTAAEQGLSGGATVVIGLGGGSAMDAAKAVAAAIGGADLTGLLRDDKPAPATTLPVVCIPTTAGTGSETSRAAIISDEARRTKQGLRGDALVPRVAIVDPELLATLPPAVVALTGFDVLAHAIETWVSRRASALTAVYSRHAIAAVFRHLPRLISDREDREARRGMSLASTLMGWNLANSTTALPHRLQYPVGARTDSSHPAGLAALYPAWSRRAAAVAPEPFRCIASLGGANDADSGHSHLMAFMQSIGVTGSLTGLGLGRADCPALVREVTGDLSSDPTDSSPESLLTLYEESL